MSFTTRMYRDEQDLIAMRALVAANRAAGSVKDHVGDITWGVYLNTSFDPHTSIRLCEDYGKLLGYVWVYRPSDVQWTLDPTIPEDDAIAQNLVAWGEAACQAALGPDTSNRTITTSVPDDLHARIGFVLSQGYARTEEFMHHFEQSLEVDLPEPVLPPGWTIRSVGNEDEWQARVDIHRDVWHPSKVTMEAYRRLRRAPGYDPDLDLVAVAPTGEFGAYCICWTDEQNSVAEFEPVGTRSTFRQLGLGKTVIREGLRRLQQRGMRRALVYTPDTNVPATKLYLSAGFQIVNAHRQYSKAL